MLAKRQLAKRQLAKHQLAKPQSELGFDFLYRTVILLKKK
jgi:hypothetical protein